MEYLTLKRKFYLNKKFDFKIYISFKLEKIK
jgi:hypothetical protein